jgi:hypothetical protein
MSLDSIAAVQARIAQITGRTASSATTRTAASTNTTAGVTDPGAVSFQSVLDAALGVSGTAGARAGLSTPVAGSTRSLVPTSRSGPLTPPAELTAFGNGRIPAQALTEIGVGNHRLWGPAAQAFQQLLSDAAAQGIEIGVTDSYRSYESQVDLARRKGLYSNGGLAATPGTSNHGWGLSVDLDLNPAAQAWMRANGDRYGFVEDVPREPWHWTFRAL